MRENICLQCNKTCFGPINRLVQDACGHKKCRTCLLADEQQCTQCEADNSQNGLEKKIQVESDVITCDRNGETNSEVVLNNHTAVIKVNGGYPKVKKNNVSFTSKSIEENENEPVGSVECDKDKTKSSLKATKEGEGKLKIKKPDKIEKKAHNPIDIPKHINVNTDPVSYHCTICDKHFVTKTHVKYHLFCSGATKPFKCDVCQKEFILRAQLDVHSYKHKSSKPFSCSICKKSFTARNKLTRHSAVHSAVKSHICSICGSAYRSKESLKIHLIIHKGEKPYGCKLCPAKFNNQSNLNKHATTHSKEKAHMCDQCGKRFKQKWALSIHRRSHSRIRPHECSICHRAFVNLKDLQRHSFIHAESKAYSCSLCELSFRRSDNLRRHMKNTHPGKNGEVIKKPVTPPQVTVAKLQKITDTSSSQPVDNPNAINVIMTASAPSSAFSKAEVALQVRQQRLELLDNQQHQEQMASSFVSLPPQSDCRAPTDKNSNNGAGDDVNATSTTSRNYANADTNKQQFDATTQQRPTTTTTTTSGVINGPIKLAFKTPAFKSSYNINRNFNYIPTTQHQKSTYDMAESVNICQKILSTSSTPVIMPQPSRNIIIEPRPPTSEEICQKILDPNSEPKIHYETSFQNRKHAMIKNIKFKVPAKYTSKFRESNVTDKSFINNVNHNNNNNNNSSNIKNTLESVAATSVIVNNSVQFSNSMEHWRRRTSQNLGLKN